MKVTIDLPEDVLRRGKAEAALRGRKLRELRLGQEKILEWIERGELTWDFTLLKETPAVRALWRRYANVPMSLADACVVRMAELHPRALVCALDSAFPFTARR